jgi:hypothetical protein
MFPPQQQPVVVKPPKTKDEEGIPNWLSGYYYFCGEMRAHVRAEKPDMRNDKVTREVARRWFQLGASGQKCYNDYAKAQYAGYKYIEAKRHWSHETKTTTHTAELASLTPVSSCSQTGA